jgi:hypothetical protein
MADHDDLPERRVKNYWAALIAAGGIIIGIILITRYDAIGGVGVIAIGFIIASVFWVLNNRWHIHEKSEDKEPAEFNR